MIKGLLAATLSLAIVFQAPWLEAPAKAAVCTVAGGQSGSLKYSGQLSTISATVCGNQIWKLLGKPKKPTKPVKPSKPRKYAHDFTVTPDRPQISGMKNLSVNETDQLEALTKKHTRNRMLFWYPAQVKFTPKNFLWNFGDGTSSTVHSPTHVWLKKGAYGVTLKVGFAVKYRIIGRSSWISLAGYVYSKSYPLTVTVGENPSKYPGNVVLVHWLCNEKPEARGC